MKLHELGAQRPQEQVTKTIRSFFGNNVSFDALKENQTREILGRVRGLLKEYKTSVSRHYSERNPDYLKLVMMEQALVSRLSEFDSKMGAYKAASATGTQGTMLDKAVQNAAAGKQLDPNQRKAMAAMAGGINKMMSDPQSASRLQQMLQKTTQDAEVAEERMGKKKMHKAVKESRRSLRESELQQAQVVMAAQDMVDQLQKMLEQVSAMQFKDLPALTDAIKNDLGVDQATQFQSDATAALTNLLTAIQTGKQQMESAQGVLTGQAPQVPGATDAAAMPAAEPGAEVDADLSLDANLPAEPEDEEEVEVSALGRERR